MKTCSIKQFPSGKVGGEKHAFSTMPNPYANERREVDDGGDYMAQKMDENPKRKQQNRLKWEVAEELNLQDDLAKGGDELSVREAGKIGGNMVRKLVKKGKEAITKED